MMITIVDNDEHVTYSSQHERDHQNADIRALDQVAPRPSSKG